MRVEKLLKRYQSAKCVITSRLHCALPCLALKTPVILVCKPEYEDRMQSFLKLLHVTTPEEFGDYIAEYDVSNPPDNDPAYLEIRKNLEKRCEEFIKSAEEGNFRPGFSRSLEEVHLWQRDILDHAEFCYRTTINELSKWCKELESGRNWLEREWKKETKRAEEAERQHAEAERQRVTNVPIGSLMSELWRRIKRKISR